MSDSLRQSPSGAERPLSTDDIDNDSNVAGETVSDALDGLSGSVPTTSSQVQNASLIPGATVTVALSAVADPVTTARIQDAAFTRSKLTGGVLVALSGNLPQVTANVTNLSPGVLTIAANTTLVGDYYHSHLAWELIHTAAATPQLICECLYNGVVVTSRTVTPVAVAGTYHGSFDCWWRFSAIGGAGVGTGRVAIQSSNDLGSTLSGRLSSDAATNSTTVDTTASQTLEFRCRMVTAVASNTLSLFNAYIEKLINS